MKVLGLIVLWLAGSGAAIGIAWTGVGVVDDEIINPAPATDFRDAPEEAGPVVSSAAAVDADDEGDDNRDEPDTAVADPATVAESTTGSAPSNGPSPDASTPTSTSTSEASGGGSATSTTTPSTSLATTSTMTAAPPASTGAQVLTFNLIGGSTAISFSSSGTEVLWATPGSGFEVKVENEPPGIKVEFRADHHRSRIDAWWAGGPQHTIREDPE